MTCLLPYLVYSAEICNFSLVDIITPSHSDKIFCKTLHRSDAVTSFPLSQNLISTDCELA